MDISIIIAGYNSLMIEPLGIVFNQKGYKTTVMKGSLHTIQNKMKESKPEVVVWDDCILLRHASQIMVTHKLFEGDTATVLILNSFQSDFLDRGLTSGIRGFLHIESEMQEMELCMKNVLNDGMFISPRIMGSKRASLSVNPFSKIMNKESTDRECEIMMLISEDRTSREIAKELFISHRTVQNHRQNICKKLGLKGRNALQKFSLHYQHISYGQQQGKSNLKSSSNSRSISGV